MNCKEIFDDAVASKNWYFVVPQINPIGQQYLNNVMGYLGCRRINCEVTMKEELLWENKEYALNLFVKDKHSSPKELQFDFSHQVARSVVKGFGVPDVIAKGDTGTLYQPNYLDRGIDFSYRSPEDIASNYFSGAECEKVEVVKIYDAPHMNHDTGMNRMLLVNEYSKYGDDMIATFLSAHLVTNKNLLQPDEVLILEEIRKTITDPNAIKFLEDLYKERGEITY